MFKNDKYDLEERTALLGENVLKFCKTIKYSNIVGPIINQIVRSSTSIGANYMEANGACSRKDFINKVSICKKEARETKHWLRMLLILEPDKNIELQKLWQEAHELTLIFSKIIISSKEN